MQLFFIKGSYGRGAGVGRGLGVGVHLPVHGVGVGVGVGVTVGVAVAVAVGVGVDVGVGLGVADCTQYLPPVRKGIMLLVLVSGGALHPPQMIISLPVQTAV